MHEERLARAFVEFSEWNLQTSTYGNPETSYADGADYPRVKVDSVELPHSDDGIRAYYASTNYYAAAPQGRTSVTAALVPVDGDTSVTEGLTLVRRDGPFRIQVEVVFFIRFNGDSVLRVPVSATEKAAVARFDDAWHSLNIRLQAPRQRQTEANLPVRHETIGSRNAFAGMHKRTADRIE